MSLFIDMLGTVGLEGLWADRVSTLQVNLGLRCNQQCGHCHVEAGPGEDRMMSAETVDAVLDVLSRHRFETLDITGGAPELHSDFRRLVSGARPLVPRIIDRCNLTVLLLPVQRDTPEFLRDHRVEITASLPCYTRENVDAARGPRVFERSIAAIRWLNTIGYGRDPELILNLAYNPGGPVLPAKSLELEADYREELASNFGVTFNHLVTLANAPIGRFDARLRETGQREEYIDYLVRNFNPDTLPQLMCRRMVSVGWDGWLYDCDFNLALSVPVNHGVPDRVTDFNFEALCGRQIVTGDHCLACAAGSGSSCGGELVSE